MNIKKEVGFALNSFKKVDVKSDRETIAQILQNILFLRPGQIPSMPFIGVDIGNYLNPMIDNGEMNDLSERIALQCTELLPYLDFSGISVNSINYQGVQHILIIIPITINSTKETIMLGVHKDTNGRVIFKYEFEDSRTT